MVDASKNGTISESMQTIENYHESKFKYVLKKKTTHFEQLLQIQCANFIRQIY